MDARARGIRDLARFELHAVEPQVEPLDGGAIGDGDDEREPRRIVDAQGELGGDGSLHA